VRKFSTMVLALTCVVVSRSGAQTLSAPSVREGPMFLAGADIAAGVANLMRVLEGSGIVAHRARLIPPAPRNSRDPADSLYRLARRAMADESYQRAAQITPATPCTIAPIRSISSAANATCATPSTRSSSRPATIPMRRLAKTRRHCLHASRARRLAVATPTRRRR